MCGDRCLSAGLYYDRHALEQAADRRLPRHRSASRYRRGAILKEPILLCCGPVGVEGRSGPAASRSAGGVPACPWRIPGLAYHPVIGEFHERCLYTSRRHPRRQPGFQRVRGMSCNGRYVGSSPALPYLRARRLLRFLKEPACHETFSRDAASHHSLVRAG